MFRVKVFGAGSIGNHLTHGCRSKGWKVTMCDLDEAALKRTREEIYPSRYGRWDDEIRLTRPQEVAEEEFDLVIVGTPPDTHLSIALETLKTKPPKALLIEKPLATPSLEGCEELRQLAKQTGTFVATGYNHTLTPHSSRAAALIEQGILGTPLTMDATFREYWGGIMLAHPWLSGPEATYLGYWERGGGASGEHSHAINIWQHYARLLGVGKIKEVSASLDYVQQGKADYDRICQLQVKTTSGFIGRIVQDVISEPSEKSVRIWGDSGSMEWVVNKEKDADFLSYHQTTEAQNEPTNELFSKTRPDDFKGEIDELDRILKGEISDQASSPIELEKGLETMLVIAAVHLSQKEKKIVCIDYDIPISPDALSVIK